MAKESKLMQRIHKQRENRWRRSGRDFNKHFQMVKQSARSVISAYQKEYK